MPAPNGSRDRGTDATTPTGESSNTPRTIEEIEQRAEEIDGAERDAMRRIAALLRDLAVELPHESKLPVLFAATAKRIDGFAEFRLGYYAVRDLNNVVEEWGREAVEEYADRLEDFLGRR